MNWRGNPVVTVRLPKDLLGIIDDRVKAAKSNRGEVIRELLTSVVVPKAAAGKSTRNDDNIFG